MFVCVCVCVYKQNNIIIIIRQLRCPKKNSVIPQNARSNHDHEAVAEGADADHEVRQWQPELEQPNSPLVVVESVEKHRILAIALRTGRDNVRHMKRAQNGFLHSKHFKSAQSVCVAMSSLLDFSWSYRYRHIITGNPGLMFSYGGAGSRGDQYKTVKR